MDRFEKRSPGVERRPKMQFRPTAEQRERVEKLVGFGVNQADIATVIKDRRTGKPISGKPCACGGTGKMDAAGRYYREQMVEAWREIVALKALLADCRPFIRHPNDELALLDTDYDDLRLVRAIDRAIATQAHTTELRS